MPSVYVMANFDNIQELRLKDEECQKLLRIQEQMNEEVDELTAKLFEVNLLQI